MIYAYRIDGEFMGEYRSRRAVIDRYKMSRSTLSRIMSGDIQSWRGQYYFFDFEVKDFEAFINIHNAPVKDAAKMWASIQEHDNKTTH